jgi:hypothetical protein
MTLQLVHNPCDMTVDTVPLPMLRNNVFDAMFNVKDHDLSICGVVQADGAGEDLFRGGGVPVMENGPQDGLEDTMVAPEDATESLLAATEPTSHASTPGGPPGGPPISELMAPIGAATEPPEAENEEGQGTCTSGTVFRSAACSSAQRS